MTSELRSVTVEVDAWLLDRMVEVTAAAYDWQDCCLCAPEHRVKHDNLRNAAGELLNALREAQRRDAVFEARRLFWKANPHLTLGELNERLPLEPVATRRDESPEPMHAWSHDA